jgi:hypothetical protein
MIKGVLLAFSVIPPLSLPLPFIIRISLFGFVDSFVLRHSDFVIQSLEGAPLSRETGEHSSCLRHQIATLASREPDSYAHFP